MSFFSWFSSGRRKRNEARASLLADSGFSRIDSGRPVHGAPQSQPAQASAGTQRRHERLAHREQLYAVVREAMVRAGVLSSSYKFKVLSLDPNGRQFMVMMDVAPGALSDTRRTTEVEAAIMQSARARHQIQVTGVYWRASEQAAAADAQQRMPAVSQPAPLAAEVPRRTHSRPAPLEAVSRPAPLGTPSHPAPLAASSRPAPLGTSSRPAPLTPSRPAPLEPLQADEVAAFRDALDAGLRGERALAAAGSRPPQNYTLLTGFEDTEMASDDQHHLSGTQFGALR
ncbi:MAG TPA: hypothetical protein VFM98_03065 [Ramlibacter sp.]|uniref:hypothetical protein n=1 Tax=Ramlibacter sp. TaxID=1917967 RepID=UPI002D80D778|nr:hypothetical protein [Ramlibacter sp.]HET8744559.1 hypothetical protein [Ramlibacter sp.]